jgi:alpha-1,6-mannosyltransferase
VLEGIATPPPTGGWPDAWPGPGLRLLHLGRLEARKRPELAIDTLAALRRSGVEASLVLAGEGARSELAERAAGLPVRLTGRVTDADKWRLYDSADVLLFGSTLEGFGLVVAEAQSRGVPVVAAAGTATAEALDDGRSGLLAAPTPDAFAAAVRDVAGRRAQMGAAAREFARRFDWDACAAAVADIYRGLVR